MTRPELDELEPAQRRRAEALILAHYLWPAITPDKAVWVARWVIAGAT